MNAIEIISQDLFDKVRSRYSNLEMGDETGNVTSDPREARFFDFDYTIEGNNLGRVSISINERGSLKVFYGQGILENADPISQEMWFTFLREMRNFAKRRLLRFDTRDITKSNLDKTDFQYLASVGTKEDTMSESKMFGSSKSSYLPLEKTRLIVRHSGAVDETQRGARSRNINSIYIENAEGERFKYPFIHLAGAKAMQRHVANGGRPYDDHGKAIIKMSENIAQLAAFKKHVGKHDSMHADANDIMERACMKLDGLRNHIGSLSKQHHYDSWKESFQPMSSADESAVLDQATMENYKSKFTVSTFAEDLSQYFPLIHSIMHEAGEVDLEDYVGEDHDHDVCPECKEDPCVCGDGEKTVKEFREFEAWADAIVEGKMGPDTLASLKELLSGGALTLGVDGTSAIEALEGIGITDEELNSALEQLAKLNPEADPTPTIGAWIAKADPAAAQELGLEQPAPAAPEGEVPAAPEGEEQPAAEDMEDEIEQPEPSIREVAEMVKSFYDRETGKFPLGETGVVTKIRKEMGERAGMLAEKLIQKLTGGQSATDQSSEQPVDELRQSPEMADLGEKIMALNKMYVRAKLLNDELTMKKIKERIAQLSAKRAALLEPEVSEARGPLKGHPYHDKSDAELKFIIKDAGQAAQAMKGHNPRAEAKYLDQVNDASTVLYHRRQHGVTDEARGPSQDFSHRDRDTWDSNMPGFRGVGGRRDREDDEHHHLDVPRQDTATWYLNIDGRVWRKDGVPVSFSGKENARKAGMSILKRNPGKKIILTTNPNAPVAESKLSELSKGTLKSYSKERGATVHADQRDAKGAKEMSADSKKHGDTKKAAAWDDEADWLDKRAEKGAKNVAKATTKIAKKTNESKRDPDTTPSEWDDEPREKDDKQTDEGYTGHYNDDDWYEVDPSDKVLRHAGGHASNKMPFGQDHIKQPNGNRLVRGMKAKYMKPREQGKTNESIDDTTFNAIMKLAGLAK